MVFLGINKIVPGAVFDRAHADAPASIPHGTWKFEFTVEALLLFVATETTHDVFFGTPDMVSIRKLLCVAAFVAEFVL